MEALVAEMTAAFAEFQGKREATAAVLAALEEELALPRLELTAPLPPLGDGPDEVRSGGVAEFFRGNLDLKHIPELTVPLTQRGAAPMRCAARLQPRIIQ